MIETLVIVAIISLIAYIFLKLSEILSRAVAAYERKRYFQRNPESSIHVDSRPKKERRGSIKGGDYVDYEEVK